MRLGSPRAREYQQNVPEYRCSLHRGSVRIRQALAGKGFNSVPLKVAIAEQLNGRSLGALNLFSSPKRLCTASSEKERLPHDLIEAFKLRGVQSDWADSLEAAYYAERPLLDGELQDILYHCADFKAPRIFIQAPFLAELLNDDILRTIFSAHTKEVIVCYNRNDYQADATLERMGKLQKTVH